MSSDDQIELVSAVELFDDIMTKDVADSSIVVAPALNVVFRIGPKQVAEKPSVGHFLRSDLLIYDFQVIQVWTQSSVHA